MWQEVIKFLGGATVFMVASAWLIRSLVVHRLGKDIEQFKHQLKIEAEKELATLRSTLEIENSKLQIKLSTLEARRISFVEELYGLFVGLHGEADAFAVEPLHEDREELIKKADRFIDAFFEFYRYFEKHEIFIPVSVAAQVKALHDDHFKAALDIHYSEGAEQDNAIMKFKQSSQEILQKSNTLKRNLSNELRKLLGVES